MNCKRCEISRIDKRKIAVTLWESLRLKLCLAEFVCEVKFNTQFSYTVSWLKLQLSKSRKSYRMKPVIKYSLTKFRLMWHYHFQNNWRKSKSFLEISKSCRVVFYIFKATNQFYKIWFIICVGTSAIIESLFMHGLGTQSY